MSRNGYHGRYDWLKKCVRILFLICMFSFLVSYSSSGSISFLHHYIIFYPRIFLASFLSNLLERKYMFLICNGILAFIIRSSVCGSSYQVRPALQDGKRPVSRKSAAVAEKEYNIGFLAKAVYVAEEEEIQLEKKEEALARISTRRNLNEEDESSVIRSADAATTNREDEKNNADISSTAELNKKFDEFIRKMKEEIRLEARQQLIAA